MTSLRTAWRRAVTAVPAGPTADALGELLAFIGPDAGTSHWTCDEVEAVGPLAAEFQREAEAGPIPGVRLAELAAGITDTLGGVFEATRPGDDRPWLALRADAGGQLAMATRSRALLDDLRRSFRGQSE